MNCEIGQIKFMQFLNREWPKNFPISQMEQRRLAERLEYLINKPAQPIVLGPEWSPEVLERDREFEQYLLDWYRERGTVGA